MIFKLIYRKEIHLYNQPNKFEDMITFIKKTFQNLPQNINLIYYDEQDDQISISNDEDLQTISLLNSSQKFIKIMISQPQDVIQNINSDDQVFQQLSFINKQIDNDDDQLLTSIVKNNQEMLNNRAIKKNEEMEHEMIEQMIRQNIQNISCKVVKNIMNHEQQMIKLIAKEGVENIIRNSMLRYQQILNEQKINQQEKQKKKREEEINKVVDNRLRQLVPVLIHKITKMVETRLKKTHCQICSQSQIIDKIFSNDCNEDIQNCEEVQEIQKFEKKIYQLKKKKKQSSRYIKSEQLI